MRPAHLLALAGLLASPPAAHSAPAASSSSVEHTATLQLLRPDEVRHANKHVVLGCPDGKLRMLDTDGAGRVTVDGDLAGCTIHTLLDDQPHGAAVPTQLGAHTAITLRPGVVDTKFVPREEAPLVGGPAQTGKAAAGSRASASRDSAGISLAGTTSATSAYEVDGLRTGLVRLSVVNEFRGPSGRSRREGRRRRRAERRASRRARRAGADVPRVASTPTPEPGEGRRASPAVGPEVRPTVVPTLTAGAVDDVDTPRGFHRYLETLPADVPLRESFTGPHRVVQVVDNHGRAVAGARVTLGGRVYRSRRDGRVVLIPGWDAVAGADASPPIVADRSLVATLAADVTQVVLTQTIEPPTPRVDLALVIDTTGSMIDELAYIKAELAVLLTTLKAQYSRLDIRWGLVVYRDEGDTYVTRRTEFTSDFDAFSAVLSAQASHGGGDSPEAVQAAFAEAGALDWRDAAVAGRVLVHVADAPPHTGDVAATLQAVDALRRDGTAIYPVAASGTDALAEYTMRTAALMSGGQYVFLTDHSGVGGPHREATAACFHVAPLMTVLGKILSAELDGRRANLQGGSEGEGCQNDAR